MRIALALAALALLAFATPVLAAKTDGSPAAQFVQGLGDKALTSLTAKDLAANVRAQRVRSLLRENFDIQTIGRFVMGNGWKTATPAQKSQYMSLFEDMIVATYTKRFADYSGQSFKVTGSSAVSDSDSLVKSQILQKDGPAVMVDWRVRKKDGGMKVVDVVVENISMSLTQRDDFRTVLNDKGVDGLIEVLRQRAGKPAGK
ncbi:MAG TPA: ABC transporter substrate-binding protein [Patescibacteria group bacterium]|nr:ABC transporter substrate-binding protein [Patescibacteria group bacterium]